MAEPLEAPPAYSTNTATTPSTSSHLAVPTSPSRADSDRSTVSSAEDLADHLPKSALHELADASRELPEGWIKELDAASGYFYYVDTKASPPRSIWCHPFDNEYLSSLPDIDPTRSNRPSSSSAAAASTSSQPITNHRFDKLQTSTSATSSSNASASGSGGKKTFGRKLKDKLTGTTHEQREQARAAQKALERREYEAYLAQRAQMIEAQRNNPTYQPRYLAPMNPYSRGNYSGYGSRYGGGYGGRGMGMGGPMLMGGALGLGGGLLMMDAMGGGFGGGGFDGGCGGGGF